MELMREIKLRLEQAQARGPKKLDEEEVTKFTRRYEELTRDGLQTNVIREPGLDPEAEAKRRHRGRKIE